MKHYTTTSKDEAQRFVKEVRAKGYTAYLLVFADRFQVRYH